MRDFILARLAVAVAVADDIKTSLVELSGDFIAPEDEDGSERTDDLTSVEENVRFLAEILERAKGAMEEAEAADWQDGEGEEPEEIEGDPEDEDEDDEGEEAA